MLAAYLLFPDSVPKVLKPMLLPGIITSATACATRDKTHIAARQMKVQLRMPSFDPIQYSSDDVEGVEDATPRKKGIVARIKHGMRHIFRRYVPARPAALQAWCHATEVLHQVAGMAVLDQ